MRFYPFWSGRIAMDPFLWLIACIAYAVIFVFTYMWQSDEKVSLSRTAAISLWVTIAILTSMYVLLLWWLEYTW